MDFLNAKPVLIGIHLVFAITGIDGFLWLLGELAANTVNTKRRVWAATIGVIGLTASWFTGGYYYLKFYGSLVKPVIVAGVAPWAHEIFMETKEHIFLFVVPMAFTGLCIALLDQETINRIGLKRSAMWLVGTVAGIGLLVGAMGYIISSAARWG